MKLRTIRPLPQTLSDDDKRYLSRLFVTKDKFSIAQATSQTQGNFIVYGTSPQENLETTLSILRFLDEQQTEEYPRESIIYWTKHVDQYVDESVFDKDYHHTVLETVVERCVEIMRKDTRLNRESVTYIYVDELVSGKVLKQLQYDVCRYSGRMTFLSIIAENFEEALVKINAIQDSGIITAGNIGSLSSKKDVLTHLF